MKADIELHDLFPSLSLETTDKLPEENPENNINSLEELVAFKAAAMKGGVCVRTFAGLDFDELCDRGSTFFYPSTQAEREDRLRDIPQTLLLIPLIENKLFFEGVFSDAEDVEEAVAQHCAQFEPVREVLNGYVMVESLLSDNSALLNGLLAF